MFVLAEPLTTGDKIKAIRLAMKLKQKDFSQLIKIPQPNLSDYENGKVVPGDRIVKDILRLASVSELWWKTEEGAMFTTPEESGDVSEFFTPYNAQDRGSSSKLNMWWVPAKVQAGFIRGFQRRIFPSQIERGSMPVIQGECFGFEIEGFSMYPDYMPGSYVVCTLLDDANWLRKGKIYVFQTQTGLVVKIFDRIEADYLYLESSNNNYNPVEPILVSELQQLYNIEFNMSRPN